MALTEEKIKLREMIERVQPHTTQFDYKNILGEGIMTDTPQRLLQSFNNSVERRCKKHRVKEIHIEEDGDPEDKTVTILYLPPIPSHEQRTEDC